MLRDVRYALRQWFAAPGFAGFSLCVLGVGIGVSLGLFGLFDALALRQLPIHEPDRIVSLQVVPRSFGRPSNRPGATS